MSALSQWQGLVRQKLFLASRLLGRAQQDSEAADDMALRQSYLQGALALTVAAREAALIYIARSHQLAVDQLQSPDDLLNRLSEDNPERIYLSDIMAGNWWRTLDSLESQASRPAPEKRRTETDNIIAVSAPSAVRLSEEVLDSILKDMKGWFSELCERYGEW